MTPSTSTVQQAPSASPSVPASQPQPKPAAPQGWSQAEIDQARARCTNILRGLDIVSIEAAPIKDGAECGAPAPIELISVGKSPQVTFSPPVFVTCDLAVALNSWINRDLQPLARKHLGGPLVQIATMSSYSCRNAYGRVANRLSEHGRANALDIRQFVTSSGQAAVVLADWGPTGRDIRNQVAQARAAAQKAEAERAAAAAKLKNGKPADPSEAAGAATATASPPHTPGTNPVTTGSAVSVIPTPGITISGRAGSIVGPSSGGQPESSSLGLSGGMAPQRLGGPKPANGAPLRGTTAPNPADATMNRMQFLRSAHETACRLFGTVLGPEANEAHRNHFHVDLAERKSSNFCE